ncbi:DUF5667 domain-containing protein [Desulfitobacterium sp. THU1]|uniref:DUF5667 domain-containing protein n=1 Tax=Desulfitobacterium sp. THU1 TaxID=3138072 RepID=UPI00311F29B7
MKKPIALILAAALMALPVSPVIALADTTEEATVVSAAEVNPGTLPDSPLYWLDELVEKLQVALTFDSQKKIKLLEKHANERMSEVLALAEKVNSEEAKSVATETKDLEESEEQEKSVESTNEQQESKELTKATTSSAIANPELEKKLKGCEKALTRYNEKIAQAQELLEQLENPESEEYKNLQAALAKVNANNVIVLGNLLEKLPPQASQRLALNIVRSMEKAVDKMEKMEANQEEENIDAVDSVDTVDNVSKPVEVKKIAPVVSVSDTLKQENVKVSDELAKEEYKELSKEAKAALKQFQEELGLKGPEKEHDKEKEKSKDYDRDREEWKKESEKFYSVKSDNRNQQKDHNDKNDLDRDDDRGNKKGSRERD